MQYRTYLYLPLLLVLAVPLVGCSGLRASLGRLIAGSAVERVASGVLYRICQPATGSEDLLVLWAAQHGVECDGATVSIEVPRRFRESWLEASSLRVGESFWATLEPDESGPRQGGPRQGGPRQGALALPAKSGYRALAISRRPAPLNRRAARAR